MFNIQSIPFPDLKPLFKGISEVITGSPHRNDESTLKAMHHPFGRNSGMGDIQIKGDGGYAVVDLKPTDQHCNGYGFAHGGWTAMALDEIGAAAAINNKPASKPVTTELLVRYLGSIRPNEPITVKAIKIGDPDEKGRQMVGSAVFQGEGTQLKAVAAAKYAYPQIA